MRREVLAERCLRWRRDAIGLVGHRPVGWKMDGRGGNNGVLGMIDDGVVRVRGLVLYVFGRVIELTSAQVRVQIDVDSSGVGDECAFSHGRPGDWNLAPRRAATS